ncbi:MAG: TIGR01777 family oxidoreductase [Phycisphaerales bacterium]
MRVLVTGATGSIGRRLVPALLARAATRDDRIAVVTRRPRDARRLFGGDVEVIAGNCAIPGPWQQAIDGADVVVHLAGAGVADRRWSRRHRELIETSRVESTHHVVNAIEDAKDRPHTLVSASATGFYGDVGDELAHEGFPAGKGFLADVCVRWEAEAQKAAAFNVRVVRARIGLVMDERGPALRRMLPWFRAGFGAVIGNGRQRVPWIWHGDCVAAILRCIDRRSLEGAVNIAGPGPCTQRIFAKAVAKAVGRPLIVRVPWIALRVAFGGIADELVRSQGVLPRTLLADGFVFKAPTIEACMAELLREDEAAAEPKSSTRSERKAAASLPKPSRPPSRPRLLVVSSALVDDGGQRRAGVREAVRLASSRGCAVVIAGDDRGPVLGPLLVDPLLHPISIAANGAVLWNHREGRAVFADRIEPATVGAISLALRRSAPSATIVFEGEEWIASEAEEIAGFGRVNLRLNGGELPPKPCVRVHVVGAPDVVAAARASLEGPFWRERKVTLFARGATLLTIAAPLVDRAVAAQRIARRLGASRDETMTLVTDEHDVGLADWSGFCVASAEAPASVRRLAGAVLDASDDPLGEAVRRFVAAG